MKKSPIRLLISDDEKNLRKILLSEFSDNNFEISEQASGSGTLDYLEKNECDVLILDLNMPDIGGMEVLKRIKSLDIPAEVIILTGNATVSTAVEAMKLGAYDYLTKPFKIEELKIIIQKAYEKKRLLDENLQLKTQIKRQSGTSEIITGNPVIREILETAAKMALSDLPVLIYGESGVGKELVAGAIHYASERSEMPFIPVNCAAIPENMLESELFGHEKGSFTGAYAKKPGLLEMANNGTLFLDEIGELSPNLQSKLLRVIESGKFFRIGGTKEIKVDVRFVSATNRDIKPADEKGSFRADLYYRIGALTLHIPPLRERKDDILLLIEHFTKNNPEHKDKTFSRDALKMLTEYPWPGNVRELKNVVHRILLLSKNNLIEAADLPSDLTGVSRPSGSRLEDVERDHIIKVLKAVDGHRGKASEILGIDPKTLYRKLLAYGIKE